jgi:hypothetical protein
VIICRSPAFNALACLFALMAAFGCSVWTPAKAQVSAGSVTRAYTSISYADGSIQNTDHKRNA